MEKDDIQTLLIDAINKNQKYNGILDCDINSDTRPIGELDRFDSLTAAEVVTELEQIMEDQYNLNIDLDVSLFYTNAGRKALTKAISHSSQSVEEIAENIYHQLH